MRKSTIFLFFGAAYFATTAIFATSSIIQCPPVSQFNHTVGHMDKWHITAWTLDELYQFKGDFDPMAEEHPKFEIKGAENSYPTGRGSVVLCVYTETESKRELKMFSLIKGYPKCVAQKNTDTFSCTK
jgi:hypothetical protein